MGDRTTEDLRIVRQFRTFGGSPQEGMCEDDAVRLARSFGYRATANPARVQRDWESFSGWLDGWFGRNTPVMLIVDLNGTEREGNHWWVVYGDPECANLWVMDPLEADEVFECLPRSEIKRFASCNDGEGYIVYSGVAISARARAGMTPAPPSAALMEFVNENMQHDTGWTSEAIASALVDNHFTTISAIQSLGAARGQRSVAVSDLVARGGDVQGILDAWDTFFTGAQRENMESLRAVLDDVEAHLNHRVARSESAHVAHDIALNLILIGTNLMDG